MVKIILLVIVILVAAFIGVAAMQPATMSVERSTMVAAPPAVVFNEVNDFHQWEAWSPWAKLDPAAKNSFDGPSSGVGAGFGWSGDSNVGEGHMAITESKPGEMVRIKLDFKRPMEGTNDVVFKFEPADNQTKVTWSMKGEKNLVGKAMGLVIDCDKMIGGMFDQGLASMKSIAEANAKK
ncbi:MAG: SRPBCC family protein [Planctomycetes bacterium]|nr:SRPBCC family protein [Planctomycetota bacterium]